MTQTAEIIHLHERATVVKADVEDGWFKVANTLGVALCKTKLSDQESRLLNCVIYKTYSNKKKMDWISCSQFNELTGIPKNKVSEIKARLINRKILIADGNKIGVNTIVSEWTDKPKASKNTPKQGIPPNRVKNTPVQDSDTPIQGKKYPQTGEYNKKEPLHKKDINIMSCRVIDYLNHKAGKKFKHTPTNIKFVSARLKEGFTLGDIKTVIDLKVRDWLNDPRMNLYLRPSTLFNSEKFEGYLNASAASRSVSPFPDQQTPTSKAESRRQVSKSVMDIGDLDW